jgi:hypothetical protein
VSDEELIPTPIPCQWKEPLTGELYDLSPIMNSNADYYIPKNTYPSQGWDIWINICRPLVTQICGPTAAGCLQWDPKSPGGKASIGTATTLQFVRAVVPGSGVTAEFIQGDLDRKMEIDFKCDPNAGTGFPAFQNEAPTHHYNFQWTSAYACPVTDDHSTSSPKKITPEQFLYVIIAILAAAVGLLGGVIIGAVAMYLFKRKGRNSGGYRQVPPEKSMNQDVS